MTVRSFSKTRRGLLATGLALSLAAAAGASNYFVNPFDSSVPVGNTATTTIWGIDRYKPAAFESVNALSGNRLHIGIAAADHQSDGFYNTQGRWLVLDNGTYTMISGDVYVDSSFLSNERRTGIWGVAVDGSNAIQGYPILDVANDHSTVGQTTDTTGDFRFWTNDTRQIPGDGAHATAGWVNIKALTNADVDKWHHFEIRLTPTAYEAYIDGQLVYTDNCTYGSVKFSGVIMNSKNYNADYDVYWDNISAMPSGDPWGLPVDLNGNYYEPSCPTQQVDGAAATTGNSGETFVDVTESSNNVPATQGSFTPFSHATKPPTPLQVNLLGRSFQFEVDLGGTWSLTHGYYYPNWRDGSSFIVGAHDSNANYPSSGDLCEAVVDLPFPGTGFRFDASTRTDDQLIPADTTGATKFLVRFDIDGGGAAVMTVTTLDGTAPGTTQSVNCTAGSGMATAHFYTAFDRDYSAFTGGQATATVSHFTTSATNNVLYAFADDPYLKSGDQAVYRVGMANVSSPVVGFQAFGTSTLAQSLVDLGSANAYYTASPFATHFLDPRTNGLSSGQSPYGASGTQTGAALAWLPYSVSGECTNTLGIAADNGHGFVTRFSLYGGGQLLPSLLQTSNTVVADFTPPTVSITSANQSQGNVIGGLAVQGPMTIHVSAMDLGSKPSGLSGFPTLKITWADSSVTNLAMSANQGDDYTATFNLDSTVPCGPATITATAVDDSGNTNTAVANFNVNIATISCNLYLDSTSANATRWIQFVVGGGGTNHTPVTINKLVTFTSGQALNLVLNGLDGVPDCTHTLTQLWAKDPVHTLGRLVSLDTSGDGQYTGHADLHLLGGNANSDSVIDILDFGVFAVQWGSPEPVNSAVNDPGNADFDCSGHVGTVDYTFFGVGHFLSADDPLPGNYDGPQQKPKDKCTVKEMVLGGVPEGIAQAMDADKDGWITVKEVAQWLVIKQHLSLGGKP